LVSCVTSKAVPLAAGVKPCTLMFDIHHGIAAQYLAELCDRCDDTQLWSATLDNFAVGLRRLGGGLA